MVAPSKPEEVTAFTTEVKTDATIQSMKNKTMEEIINKWTGDLDRCSEQFKGQANDIRKWDAILVENGDKVTLSIVIVTQNRSRNYMQRPWKLHKLKIESIPH